jgi:hypothetical protein
MMILLFVAIATISFSVGLASVAMSLVLRVVHTSSLARLEHVQAAEPLPANVVGLQSAGRKRHKAA